MHKHVLGILVCMLLPICTSSLAKSPEEQAIVAPDKNKTNKVLTKEQNSLVNELVIIDAAVPNKHLFFQHLKAGTDVVEINSSESGFKQLESTLNKYKNLSALHLISHADDGVLYFGDSQITQQALSEKITLLSTMNHALTANADVLFYGCDLAKTEKGNALLDFISQQANVDVAASNNPTGSALQGGDWQLEVHKGDINTSPLFTASTMQSFDSVLLVDATLDLTALPLVSAPVIDVSIGGTDHVLKIESSGGVSDIQAVLGHVLLASALTTHTSVDIYLESGETFDLTNLTILNLDLGLGFGVSHKVKVTSNKGGIVESDTLLYSLLGVPLDFSGTDWEEITRITIEYSDGVPLSLLALSHISIANVVSLPSISNLNGDAFTYTEGSGVQKIDQGVAALLTDPGLLTGAYTGGTLTAEITSGIIPAEDTLTIDTGVVSLASNLVGGALTVSEVIIGELVSDILPGNILSFTLNANATPALLQILLQGLAYENVETDDPTAGVRVVSVTLTDADGETSNVSDVSITVASQNDAPTLTNLNTDILSYVLGSGAQYLDQGDLTVVVDVDSLNFLDGYLSVSITNNKDSSEDILRLGTGVDVSALVSVAGLTVGSEVSVGTVVVGTLANEIIEGNDLLIDLNANANILNIQLLIRALVYVNTDIGDASLLSRTITITLNDGDGGTSTAQLLTVDLAAPTYDNDGTLTDAAVVMEPVALPLSADSISEAVDIFDFTITDGGSSDSTPMEISQVVVNVAGTISETDLAKIIWRLNSNTPNTDVENVAGVYNSSNNTVTFLTSALSIADGSSEILTVNAYFNDPTGLTHDNTLQLSIDGDTDLTLAVGSTMDGNSAPVTNGSGSLITDNIGPIVTSVLAPVNGTYAIGDLLSFTVNFDEAVNVDITAGTPRLAITIGENTRYIDYVSGDGSTALVFTYTLVAGDIDNDGLVLNTTLDLNLGTLLDAAGNTVDTTLNNIPTLIGVLSDGLAPVLAEVTPVATLSANTSPSFTFSSSEAGTLAVGGACGSLGEGSILSGNSTIILTQSTAIPFTSGTYSDCTVTVTDAAGNATVLTLTPFTIDLTAPTVDVSAPNTLLEGASDVVITNTNLSSFDDNASAAEIIYTLVTAPSNGTLNNGSVGLGSTDTFTQADINNNDITYSHNGGESTSDSFIFTVTDSVGNVNNNTALNFNFELTITPQNDAPTLLHLHDDTLNYVLNSGEQYLDQGSLTLIADVDSVDFLNGRLSVSITTNKDSSEDKLSLGAGVEVGAAVELVGLIAGSDVKVGFDVIGTLVNDITEGNDLLIDLNADANIANIQILIRALVYVNIDSVDPSPLNRTITITLEDGDGGTSTPQTINVSITNAPIDSDGTLTSASGVSEPVALPLSANSIVEAVDIFDFTITDGGTTDGTPTVISHVAINVSGTTNDTDKAKITWRLNSNAPNTDVDNVIGVYNAIDDTITFDTPTLSIADDSSETLTVNAYYNDSTGLTHGNTLQLSIDGSTDLTLAAGSEMNSTSSPVTNGSGSVITDDVGPIVTSVSAPADDIYAIGDVLTFTVNFDEVVEVNTTGGTPRLAITIGETVRYVDYVSGDGTNALIFNYTLVDGDIDSDGLVLSASIDVNSATLADTLGNAVNTNLNNIDDLSAILLDGDSPVLAEVTAVVSPTMDTTPSFTFSSSEAGNLTVGGACGSSDVGSISSGNTTITLTNTDGFTPLTSGDYSDCTVTVTDAAGNATELTLTAFTIDATAPTVSVADITLDEGSTDTVISDTYLTSSDNNASAPDITYTLVAAPSNGTLSNAGVELNSDDTFTQADIANSDITYSHDGGESTSDTFTFTVSDAVGNVNNGGGSNLTFTVSVTPQNDAPSVLHLNGDTLNYVQGDAAQLLDQPTLAIISDADSLHFDNGSLNVSLTDGLQATEDLLGLNTNVTLDGVLADSSVTINGDVIGTLNQDLAVGTDLNIDFNVNATLANVQDLVRAITYVNTSITTVTAGTRTLTMTLNDGNGGTSLPQTLNISVTNAPIDSDGTLTSASGVSEPVALPLSANTITEAVDIFDFTITDGGTSDGTPTVVSHVAINVSGTANDTDRAKITWRLNSNAPNTDVGNVIGVYNAIDDTVTFDTPALSIADGNSEVLTVNAYYNDPTGLTHGNTLLLSINGYTDLTLAAGSEMSSIPSPVTNGLGSIITDDVGPAVTSVSVPADDTYAIGDALTFVVNFDEAVVVNTAGGTPRLAITIGETVRYVDYVSGTGTNALTFTYTLVAGDIDNDGLVLSTNLDINSGTLLDALGNAINTNLNNIPTLAGVLSDGSAPVLAEVTAVVSPTMDATPAFTFSSSEAGSLDVGGACGSSDVGSISSGNTTITLTSTDDFTSLTSGNYSDCTVTVTDAANNSSTLALTPFTIDVTAPVVTLSEITLDEGSTDTVISATYLTSTDNNSDAADITYTLVAAPNNGTLSNAGVELNSDDTFTQADIANSDITYSHNGNESTSDTFTFTVSDAVGNVNDNNGSNLTFTVTVTPQNDAPSVLHLNDDTLNYVQGETAQLLDHPAFALISDADSADFDGGSLNVAITAGKQASEDLLGFDINVILSGSAVGDSVTINSILVGTLTEELVTGSNLVIGFNTDATLANVQDLVRAITYVNTAGTVTTGTRTLSLTLEDGDGGTSTSQTLNVSVTSAPIDSDGTLTSAPDVSEPVNLPLSANTDANAVDLFDFTITDGGTGDATPMVVSHVAVNVAGSISDTDIAKITWRLNSNDPNANVNNVIGVYNTNDSTVTFDTPALSIADGGSEILTINAYYNDPTGLTHGDTLLLNIDGYTNLTLAAGSEMSSTSSPVNNGLGSIITDDIGPIVTSVSAPTNGTYAIGDDLTFTVNFDEAIVVNTAGGTPRLTITIGATTRYVDYVSGSGTNALTFTYTLIAGDIDADGLVLNTSLDVNSGTLADALGNAINTSLNNIPTLTGVLADGDAPVLTEVAAVVSPTMDTTPSFTFSSSEAGTLSLGGACGSTDVGSIPSGNTTITLTDTDNFAPLTSGDYSDCTVIVTDAAGNATELTLTAFTIDTLAPSVDVFAPNTVNEGASDIITSSNLSSSDNNDSAADITYTLLGVPSNGTLSKNTVSLLVNDTFTQADIDNEAITYSHNGAELSLDSFTFNVSDSAGNVNNNAFVNFTYTLSVTEENDAPTILNLNTDILNYVQGSTAQNIDQGTLALVDDPDSSDFDGGTFTLSVITNKQETEDLLGFNETVELSYFDVGGLVSVDGIVIGTLTEDLVTGNDIVISLNNNATPTNLQTLVRAITYENTDPVTATTDSRTIRLTLDDGDGGTSSSQDMQIAITALPADIDATLTEASPVAEPVALPSSANAPNRIVDLFDFTITDTGTSDAYPTSISEMIIHVGGTINDADLAKISWYLDSNTPNTDVNYKLGIFDTSNKTITFATPTLSIDDGTSEILTLKAFYHDATDLSHGSTIELSIDGDTDLTLTAGTQMAATTPVTNGSGAAITDNTNPVVTSVLAPTNETYGLGATLNFIVNFDEGVIIDTSNGTPRLVITIGDTVRYAEYVSGSGTTALLFNYTVLADDVDSDGLVIDGSIDVNGGSLIDSAGNNVNTNLNNIDDLTEVLFDGDAPQLTEITPVATPGTDTTPQVVFSTSKAGTFAIEGACGSSDTGTLNTGEHTVTLTKTDNLTPLTSGNYSDCTVTITDATGNKSELVLTAFSIDVTAPSVDVLSPNTLDEGANAVIIDSSNLTSSDNTDSAINITYTLTTKPNNGLLSKAETVLTTNDTFSQADIDNGVITYTHDGGESTSDSFAFSLSDSLGNVNDNGADYFTFTLVVTPQNDAPNSNNDIASTTEDTTIIIDVLANDSDADGTLNKASVTIVSTPENGNVSINTTTGTITYTPNPDESGTDSFVYTVEDDQGLVSEPASVTVTIYSQNDAPTAQADSATTLMNTLVSIDVAANDTDKDTGDSLNPSTILIVSGASNGTAVFNTTTNRIDYTPSAAFSGVDTFKYTIKDSTGATSNTATVSITVTFVEGPANVAPVAVDDSANVQEDSSVVINVLGNDSDSDGTLDASTINVIAMPENGNISINMVTGAITYTPSANFNGNDSLTYHVKDNSNDTSNTATVLITIIAVADLPNISGTPSNIINEDENYSFTPNVSSNDGLTSFTFSIENKPNWAIFDTNTGTLTGTPMNADVGTFSNIQITVSDGENQASLPGFSLTVNNVNDAPFAINDNYLLTQNLSGSYSLNVLDNDYDEDIDDSINIVSATAEVGSVSINENGLNYQNGTAETPDTIKYTIEDASGSQSTAEVAIAISPAESENTPELTLPNDIEANATGLFTWLNIGTAEAFDNSGNSLAVEMLNDATLFPPGDNQVYWRTEDSEGNFVIKTQNVKVNPLVNLAPDKSVLEGKSITTKVYLNGDAPSYPLTVPYTVSGTANSSDHSLVSGEVVFTSGRQASISFTIFDDVIVEDNETIIISLGETINRGSKSTQTLSITEANLAPEVELLVSQSGEKRFIIAKSDDEGVINASIFDANSQDTHTTTWASDIVNTSSESTLFSFNPTLLDVGMHTVKVTVTDNGVPSLTVTNTVYIQVVNELTVLSEEDSDGDSIPDNLEGHADDDNDGIPNYLDGIVDCQTLQTKVEDTNSYLMEGDAGACLRIGGTVANTDSKASLITTNEADNTLGADTEVVYTGGIFDFIAYNLPEVGQSYRIVIPQRLPIPTGAVYRKYNQAENWHNFISDEKNKVYSTLGLMGYCPAPGSDLWTEGLTAGNWCVQLLIEDGGPNDDDGLANGAIIDPSGVASLSTSNNLPVGVDDVANVRTHLSVTIDALSNDTDADGHNLTLMNVSVDFGTVSIENNKVLYVADSAFIGTTNISYTLGDSEGGTATAVIVLTIEANQIPTANDDSYATTDVQAITLDVLTNDTDPEGDTLTITSASASSGNVTFTGTEIVYTPSVGTEGVETVDYEISDNNGGTATGTAYIVVTINEAPIANTDNVTINGPESMIIQVLENDTDNDNDTITVTAATALSGNVTFVDEYIIYTPPVALVDSDTISYEISDEYGNTAESTVNVTIVLKRETEFKITNSNSGGSLGYLSILFFMTMMFMRRQLKVNKSR